MACSGTLGWASEGCDRLCARGLTCNGACTSIGAVAGLSEVADDIARGGMAPAARCGQACSCELPATPSENAALAILAIMRGELVRTTDVGAECCDSDCPAAASEYATLGTVPTGELTRITDVSDELRDSDCPVAPSKNDADATLGTMPTGELVRMTDLGDADWPATPSANATGTTFAIKPTGELERITGLCDEVDLGLSRILPRDLVCVKPIGASMTKLLELE